MRRWGGQFIYMVALFNQLVVSVPVTGPASHAGTWLSDQLDTCVC